MASKAVITILSGLLLAGCVTTEVGDPSQTVSTWKGHDVTDNIPSLRLAAAANKAQAEGRVTITRLPPNDVAARCANPRVDGGVIVACTVAHGPPSHWTYDLYVNDSYPGWLQQLWLTHESGHIGQRELGLPFTESGFTNPTVGLIVRLGG